MKTIMSFDELLTIQHGQIVLLKRQWPTGMRLHAVAVAFDPEEAGYDYEVSGDLSQWAESGLFVLGRKIGVVAVVFMALRTSDICPMQLSLENFVEFSRTQELLVLETAEDTAAWLSVLLDATQKLSSLAADTHKFVEEELTAACQELET